MSIEESLLLKVNTAAADLRTAFDDMLLHNCTTFRNRKMMEFKIKLAEYEQFERSYQMFSISRNPHFPYEDG